jgi:Protein of unknown function (DUF4238)
MIMLSLVIHDFVRRSQWCILEAPRIGGFITCDDPFVTVPPSASRDENVGMGLLGSISYFPLSQRFCLRIESLGQRIEFRKMGDLPPSR